MRGDEGLEALFDDLEQQAEGLHLAERDAEVADRSRGEYGAVDLAARLHASVGSRVRATVSGVGLLEGSLDAVGQGWCQVDAAHGQRWVVPTNAILRVRGLSPRAVSDAARPATARLGLGAQLRRLAESGQAVVVHHRDSSTTRGYVGRVGADFAEILTDDPHRPTPTSLQGVVELVAFGGIAAVQET